MVSQVITQIYIIQNRLKGAPWFGVNIVDDNIVCCQRDPDCFTEENRQDFSRIKVENSNWYGQSMKEEAGKVWSQDQSVAIWSVLIVLSSWLMLKYHFR